MKIKYNANYHCNLRIIGGKWGGRKVPISISRNLRPTTHRVRETLFNWLSYEITQAHCLDCYAGSGALSIEALSRYAASATLLELKRQIVFQIKKNLALLGTTKGKVIHTNTLSWLAKPGVPFKLVFLDPPFNRNLLELTISLLEKYGWLADEAWIYVESNTQIHQSLSVPENWELYRMNKAGQVYYNLYLRYQKKFTLLM
ncbi:MAG: 16S rRNA (guanine(966)-N(2))-methyltransferase RsmD [Candidatus Dasytiphilus stammeri]